MPTSAFVVSLIIATADETHERCFLDLDALFLDATLNVVAIIGASIIESEALIKGSDAAQGMIWKRVDVILPPSQLLTF